MELVVQLVSYVGWPNHTTEDSTYQIEVSKVIGVAGYHQIIQKNTISVKPMVLGSYMT